MYIGHNMFLVLEIFSSSPEWHTALFMYVAIFPSSKKNFMFQHLES